MQYYRLWIYSCNVVLGLTSAIFIIFAAFVVTDVRLSLLEGVELYHPTFLYAYGALILQCGVVQTIGCLGAQRLSHKLLSLYWTLLLLLTLGDLGVGLYWVFHLEKVKVNLRPYLTKEFIQKYSADESFTLKWNKIQSQERCCGVDGPFDFEKFSNSQHHAKQAAFSANPPLIVDIETDLLSLPDSCCTVIYVPSTLRGGSGGGHSVNKAYRGTHYPPQEKHPPSSSSSSSAAANSSSNSSGGGTGDHPGDFAGGGRRGRTVLNWSHSSDEPRLYPLYEDYYDDEYDDEEEDDEVDTNFYQINNSPHYSQQQQQNSLESFHHQQQQQQQRLVVPDEHRERDQDHRHHVEEKHKPPDRHRHRHRLFASAVQKRDIKTFEPIHAHKVRHELHRKSQPESLIDTKLVLNSSAVGNVSRVTDVVGSFWKVTSPISNGSSSTNSSSNSSPSSTREDDITNNSNNASLIGGTNEEEEVIRLVPPPLGGQVGLHRNEISHIINKTNKSFPSNPPRPLLRRRKRKRRETETRRAFSVTQVPAVRSPIRRRHICHGQLEGLNHRSSYESRRKESSMGEQELLVDERKTIKDKHSKEEEEEAKKKTNPTRKDSLSWPYPSSTTSTTSSIIGKALAPVSNTLLPLPPPPPQTQQRKLSLSERSQEDKVEVNEIERHTKKGGEREEVGKSLLAIRVSQRIMTSGGDASASHSSNSDSVPSSTSLTRKNGRRERQKRNAEMNLDNLFDSASSSQSDPFGSWQSPAAFTSSSGEELKSSLAESYFSPLSSSSSSTSSTIAPADGESDSLSASLHHDQWNGHNESDSSSSSSTGNRTSSGGSSGGGGGGSGGQQKRLFVYGQGCGGKLIEWVDHVSGIMFILGFCIIGFAKTCFLVILRTEIREMIEKIHMIEPEEVMSPARNNSKEPRFHHVSHPLLQNPHRASTVSAHGVLLPTIKSPDGPSTSGINGGGGGGGYNRPNRHYLRRASNIVGGDRSRSHSNETVNMALLMATSASETRERRSNPNLSLGGSSGTIGNLVEERDPVSGCTINVPNNNNSGANAATAAATISQNRYLRRSSTCSSSANPAGYPYPYGLEGEPRPGPSSRFYQYFEPLYQTPHLYQPSHHHHLYARNRPHVRNMSCGAILPLASYRSNSAAAAASAAMATYRGGRSNLSTAAPSNVTSAGCSFSSKDENEMIISVSLEHIASSDLDEEEVAAEEQAEAEEKADREKKEWAAATTTTTSEHDANPGVKSTSTTYCSKVEDSSTSLGTKLTTFSHTESANEQQQQQSTTTSPREREMLLLQRRNGNNNDLAGSLPMSYIGTAV